MTRAEYNEAMRGVSKLAARTEIEAARKTRAVIRAAVKPVTAAVARGLKPPALDKTRLAEDIIGVIKSEGSKPVERVREVRAALEADIAEKYGVSVPAMPPEPARTVTLRNAARRAAGTWRDYRAGRAYGYAQTRQGISAYAKDPETGKITWAEEALGYLFTKRYDLSTLVWADVEDVEKAIFDVINGGIALARDPVDIAKDLETYIKYDDGGKRVLGRWGAMFPKTEKGIRAAWEREYLAFHDLQPGTEEANKMLSTPEAKNWLAGMMAEKTQRGTPRLPDAVKQYSRRIGGAGLDYRSIRIVRTETAAMLADEETDFAKNSYAATGKVDWILKSGREQWNCKCAEYAAGGPYDIDNLPAQIPVHPCCDCELRPRLKSREELEATFKILAGI